MAVTVGVDVGGSAVRAAVVEAKRGRRVLRRFAEIPLPDGAVVAGDIVDEAAVSEAVAALWKRHKLPKASVVVGTAGRRLVVRRVDVPQMEPEELREALPYQVQDSIPIAVDDAILDYVPLEQFITPEGEPMASILVVAIHRSSVDALVRIMGTAKVSIAAIDLQAFALARSTVEIEPAVDRPLQGIVDIGASLTQVVVVRGTTVEFVRLLARGGEDFTGILVDRLGWSRIVAEERKREIGVVPEGTPEVGEGEEALARTALTSEADELIGEVVESVRFHLREAGEESLERLIVAGNGARLPHLANRLGSALGVPIRPARILEHIDVGRVHLSEEELLEAQPVLPTAVGLALWGAV